MNSRPQHEAFFNGIVEAVSEHSDETELIIKFKVKNKEVLSVYQSLIDDCIKQNPRLKTTIASSNTSADDLIIQTSGTIAMAFTSPAIRAIALNRPGVFFDPMKSFPNSGFASLDWIYSTSPRDLADKTHRWFTKPELVRQENWSSSKCLRPEQAGTA